MKILAIMGSPRKGDSYKITQLIETELKYFGEVELKYIFLGKINLEYCRGCSVCMKKGEEFCPLKDDALMIMEEMLNADGLILVSPIYVHQVTALMKIFIDRFAYALHRPCFLDKCAMIISTTELSGLEDVLDYLEFNALKVKVKLHQKQYPCDYSYWQEEGLAG